MSDQGDPAEGRRFLRRMASKVWALPRSTVWRFLALFVLSWMVSYAFSVSGAPWYVNLGSVYVAFYGMTEFITVTDGRRQALRGAPPELERALSRFASDHLLQSGHPSLHLSHIARLRRWRRYHGYAWYSARAALGGPEDGRDGRPGVTVKVVYGWALTRRRALEASAKASGASFDTEWKSLGLVTPVQTPQGPVIATNDDAARGRWN